MNELALVDECESGCESTQAAPHELVERMTSTLASAAFQRASVESAMKAAMDFEAVVFAMRKEADAGAHALFAMMLERRVTDPALRAFLWNAGTPETLVDALQILQARKTSRRLVLNSDAWTIAAWLRQVAVYEGGTIFALYTWANHRLSCERTITDSRAHLARLTESANRAGLEITGIRSCERVRLAPGTWL